MASEFEIVKKPLHVIKPTSLKHTVTHDTKLVPAWTDETDITPTKLYKSNLHSLDINFRLQQKNKNSDNDNNVEKMFSVLPKNEQINDKKDVHMKRLFDGNRERLSRGEITSTEFNHKYKILLTASADTTLALFKFEESECCLIRDRVFERFPIKSAKFTNDAEKVVLTGDKKIFKVYDLGTGQETQPANFFGKTSNKILRKCVISPDNNISAFLSNNGRTYLIDLRTYEKIGSTLSSGIVESSCFSKNGDFLNTFSSEGSVFVFDIRHHAHPIHRWSDFSCSGGCAISVSNDCQFIACGSHSGYVNLYTWEAVMNGCKNPTPLKSFGNIITAVDQLSFHPSSSMLYMASSLAPNAARLLNIQGQQVFANFPVKMGTLDAPTSVGFSPNGGYLCIGQANGHAALFKFCEFNHY